LGTKINIDYFVHLDLALINNISRITSLIWAGHVARMKKGRSAFKILTGKPTGKRPLGRRRDR
jgi:hypothetical protein